MTTNENNDKFFVKTFILKKQFLFLISLSSENDEIFI